MVPAVDGGARRPQDGPKPGPARGVLLINWRAPRSLTGQGFQAVDELAAAGRAPTEHAISAYGERAAESDPHDESLGSPVEGMYDDQGAVVVGNGIDPVGHRRELVQPFHHALHLISTSQ